MYQERASNDFNVLLCSHSSRRTLSLSLVCCYIGLSFVVPHLQIIKGKIAQIPLLLGFEYIHVPLPIFHLL